MRKAVFGTGIFFLLFSAFYYFYLIPVHIVFSLPLPQKGVSTAALQPHFLPRIVIIIFALISTLLILGALLQREEDEGEMIDLQAVFQVGFVFVLSYFYVYALELVGFLVSTSIFLAVLIMFFGTRDWRYVAPISVLLPLGINYFFWYALQVILPEGAVW